MAVLRSKTANNSHKIPLFFRATNHQPPRISAEDEMLVADKSLQKTAKTARPAARPSIGCGRRELDRRLREYCATRTALEVETG